MDLYILADVAVCNNMIFYVIDPIEELYVTVSISYTIDNKVNIEIKETRRGIKLPNNVPKISYMSEIVKWMYSRYPFANIAVVINNSHYPLKQHWDMDSRKYVRKN